jgi:RNA polymerase sigma-70 factor (ECF subfamily)
MSRERNDPVPGGVSLFVDADVAVDEFFPDLVRCHQNAVYSIALRWTGRPSDAEDAAQETFLRAYRALKGYDADRRAALPVRPWLARIALNVCRNRARAASRRPNEVTPAAADEPASAARSPVEMAEASETAAQLADALRSLPEHQRRAVVLHCAGGLTYAEIGEATRRPEGTVKSDVSRGLAALRIILRPDQELLA